MAFNSGPVFNPEFYRRHILPKERSVAAKFTKPLISHSDGDMGPLLEDWLELGQAAIHPLQTDVMDIFEVRRRYGDRVALVGNIFMDDLVNKSPAEIDEQVRIRRELRAVRLNLDRDIEQLGTLLKVINIGLIPLGVLLFLLIRVFIGRRSGS